ncbi:MAG: SIMPL domain-containing protein [Candidatus Peribacteraceae bacterium]|nr:SIMPL domain-containing protein [Candidatus Peribacteraceae bacterium]
MSDEQTLNLRPPVWALLLAVVLGGVFFLSGKWMEQRDGTPAMISVSGEGKATAAPDIAQLTFGMQTGARPTAKDAMARLETSMNAVLAAAKKLGIEDKDISTANFYLQPQYDWNEGRQLLRGYEASETLLVKVRDLDKVSAVLTAATDAGANQAGDVNFTIDDPETVRALARQKAIEQAQEKAANLAKSLGMKLGKLKGFDEGGGYTPPTPLYERSMKTMDSAAGQAASVPLPAGEQDVSVTVNLTYELR